MLLRLFPIILLSVLTAPVLANHHHYQQIEHVIYLTLDGVRWQEVYGDHTYFPNVWNTYQKELIFYGVPGSSTSMQVASIPVSLPSYQSQMTGAVQPCAGNDCGRVRTETFPEKLIRANSFDPKDVAMFATWSTMHDSYQTSRGKAVENVAANPMHDPDRKHDVVMDELNLLQHARTRHDGDRFDDYTFAQAMHYFLKYQPKFMWISLAESDNYAHANDLQGYLGKLRQYDDYIAQLIATLKTLGLADKTMIIVTTDHGRGNGDHWTDHGASLPESKQTWAFVWHGQLVPVGVSGGIKHYSTLSIRPTVEKAFASLTA